MNMAVLQKLIQALQDSADDTGCSEDLTVVSRVALEALTDYLKENPYEATHRG